MNIYITDLILWIEIGYSMPSSDLSGLIGKHVMYTYSNGWQYEVFYKNYGTVDYRVVSGLVGGRLVKGQKVDMRQLAKGEQRYMVNWTEPTGTCVSKVVDMEKREVHSVIFFPRWVADVPNKTVCFQNDHLDLMRSYRDAGPTYPIHVVNEYGRMYYIEDCDPDDDHVISYTANSFTT